MIEQKVQLYIPFGPAKLDPGEKRQAREPVDMKSP
jgi:hypothetical protein